jgi:hypothetical protein
MRTNNKAEWIATYIDVLRELYTRAHRIIATEFTDTTPDMSNRSFSTFVDMVFAHSSDHVSAYVIADDRQPLDQHTADDESW